MLYGRMFNPDPRDYVLNVDGVEVSLPARKFVVADYKVAEKAQSMMPCLEIVEITEAEFKARSEEASKEAKAAAEAAKKVSTARAKAQKAEAEVVEAKKSEVSERLQREQKQSAKEEKSRLAGLMAAEGPAPEIEKPKKAKKGSKK